MLVRLLVVLEQVVTLFLLAAVGFILGKKKIITPEGTRQMSILLINIVTPCLIVNSFPANWDLESLHLLGTSVVATACVYIVYVLISIPLFRKEGLDQRAPLRFGSIYGNVGFMGLPLIEAVLGQDALIYAAIVIIIFNTFAFTHGAAIMGGKSALSVKRALINPGIIGVMIGLPLFLGRIALPGSIQNTLGYLGNLNTPLAMVVIGAQISRASFTGVNGGKKLCVAVIFKLLILPIVTMLLLRLFKLDHTLYITLVILAAVPSAGFTSMFSEQFGRNTAHAAQLVSVTTLLSTLTLPIIAVLAELTAT